MKKSMFPGIFAVFCFVLSVSSGITAAQSLYDSADAGRDGVVTKEDMRKALDERYRSEDGNKDGKITVDEYRDARKKDFDGADVNKDGVITVEEWAIYWCGTDKDAGKVKKPAKAGKKKASRAKAIDANKDGKIGKDECVLFWSGTFIDFDVNGDGRMSREEYLEKIKDMADIIDLDNDGVITIEEYYVFWVGDDNVAVKNKPSVKGKKPAARKPAAQK